MGVHGLWQLLQCTGKPVTLESLEGKVLSVDISMWLHQSLKGMRDREGNAVYNAHLQVLFNRICKLLYYRIQPIFVFDGEAPALKRQTLASRKLKREEISLVQEKTSKRLLNVLMKKQAVSEVLGHGEPSISTESSKNMSPNTRDLFQLPAIAEADRPFGNELQEWEEDFGERDSMVADYMQQNQGDLDVDDENFNELPLELQHELLTELQEKKKKNSWAKIHLLPSDSKDFSSYQLQKLMKQSHLSRKIDTVRKGMNAQTAGKLASEVLQETSAGTIEARQLASDDSVHYILITGLDPKQQKNFTAQTFGQQSQELHSSSKIPDDVVAPSSSEQQKNKTETQTSDIQKNDSTIALASCDKNVSHEQFHDAELRIFEKDDSRSTTNMRQNNTVFLEGQCAGISAETDVSKEQLDQVCSVQSDSTIFLREEVFPSNKLPSSVDKKNNITIPALQETQRETRQEKDGELKRNQPEKRPQVVLDKPPTDILSKSNIDKPSTSSNSVDSGSKQSDQVTSTMNEDRIQEQASSSSDEDSQDFIEVSIDPTNVKPDFELFPPSIFSKTSERRQETMPHDIAPHHLANTSSLSETMRLIDSSAQGISSQVERPFDHNVASQPDSYEQNSLAADTMATTGETMATARNTMATAGNTIATAGNTMSTEESMQSRSEISAGTMVQEFEDMSDSELLALEASLEAETAKLKQVRGQQERLGATLTDQIQVEAQELLRLFGIPFIVSPSEAEAQCAYLDITCQTEGSITDDSDVWLFGGQRVYKNLFSQNKQVEFFQAADFESVLMVNREKLVQLAYLCGSDYTDGIQGVGPVTAMEILLEFPGEQLEGLTILKNWWDEAHTQVKSTVETKLKSKLRSLVITPGFPNTAVWDAYFNPLIDDSEETFEWGNPDLDLLRDFALSKLNWSKRKVDEMLLPVMKRRSESKIQSKISSYFHLEPISKAAKTLPKSKRVKRIITRLRDGSNSAGDDEPLSQKGKASKRHPAKKSKTVDTSSSGGWVGDDNQDSHDSSKPDKSGEEPCKLNLSESSSDSEDNSTQQQQSTVKTSVEVKSASGVRRGTKRGRISGRGGKKNNKF